jgi:alkanesulfonate monooxygenase SsuD/methylene tetrahydromethanopterin reductase-like flavin-dependent oxidoreductase (luciferase family)
MNESLDVIKRLWAEDELEYEGKYYTIPRTQLITRPVQQPHPPIWIGGSSHASLRRAARFAQVWQPTPTALPSLISNRQYLKDVSAEIGREEPPRVRMSFRVTISSITGVSSSGSDRPAGMGTTEQIASDLNRYRQEAGLEEFQINCHECGDLQQLLDTMDALVQDVFPKVDG